jgi:hypothetical protein
MSCFTVLLCKLFLVPSDAHQGKDLIPEKSLRCELRQLHEELQSSSFLSTSLHGVAENAAELPK